MIHASVFRHKSPFFTTFGGKEKSGDYRVFINGQEIDVYSCRISAYPFNRVWPGYQRAVGQSELASFVNLVSDEEITVEVEPLTKSVEGKIMIKPYSKGISHRVEGDKVRFTLKENGTFLFQIDDYHGLLYIFNNRPVPCEDRASVTYYFGEGVHFPGKIILRSNESIYLEPDAYVYGCVFAENAENLRIYGNGIFDDSCEERMSEACYDPYINGNLKFYDCRKIRLEGVGYTNSALWCVNLFHCRDVVAEGINVFGQWRYNTDGIDVVNCERIAVRNSFVHSFDDTVTVKGIDRYAPDSNRDVSVEGCTLLCDWGKTCEIGLETAAYEYANIVFRDCDVIRGGNAVCDIQNGDYAEVHHVLFENIRVDLEPFYTPEVLQRTEEQVYGAEKEYFTARIFSVKNNRTSTYYEELALPETKSKRQRGDGEYASVHHVTVKDIYVYCDEILLNRFGKDCVKVQLKNIIPTTEYGDIRVENIVLNGRRLSPEEISITHEGNTESSLTVI